MQKKFGIVTLAAAAMMAMTPLTASAQSKPKYSSNYWSTARYVKLKNATKAMEYKVTTKDKKLTIVNKVIKNSKIKKGTTLYARNMGNGTWQVYNQQYPSSQKGVWLIKQADTKWFSLAKVPTISKYWDKANYATVTKKTPAIQYSVTTKNNKLNITKKVLKKTNVAVGTKLYARNMGNGTWQIYNQQYPSNKQGVWIVSQQSDNWLKKTTAPKPVQYKVYPSIYSTVSSNDIPNSGDGFAVGYAPYGFQPIPFKDGSTVKYTVNPGQQVNVRFDSQNNQWLFSDNGQIYKLNAGNNYTVSTANSQLVSTSSNNIQSYYAPDDPMALVPQGYQPQSGNLWLQLNSDGSVRQYYFYSTQNKDNPGWVKGKIQQQDGKNTIVPE